MAFDLNNLTNSVSDAFSKIGKEATNMTKSVTDNVKINGKITDQKRLIQLTYERLGRKYFELRKDNPDAEMEGEVNQIKEAMEQIADCERQLAKMKGGIACPNCGTVLNPGVAFCVKCGAKIERPVNSDSAGRPGDNPDMGRSGNNTEMSEPADNAGTLNVHGDQTVQESAEQKVCPSCGSALREGALFCSKCGAKAD